MRRRNKFHTDGETRSEDSVPEFVFSKWVAYLCAVVNYGLAIGLPFAMSVLFVDWQATFGATRAQTATVYSTNVSILFGAAIIPGFFMDRFGARFTVLVGSCLACIGCIASSFATSINFLIFSNGVLGGLGFCFIQLPSMTTVNMAFTSKYRSMAVSVCTCCVALSSMAFPFIYRFMVRHYSWRATLTIIGCLCLQTAVLGFLMTSYVKRPRPNKISTENCLSIISSEETSNTLEPKEMDTCSEFCEGISKDGGFGEDVHYKEEICLPQDTSQTKERTQRSCNHRRQTLAKRLRNSKWKFLLDFTYILFLLYECACIASLYSFLLMMMDFARTKGFDEDKTGTFFLFIIFTTSLIGRLLIGVLNLIPFLHSITLLGICGIMISCSLMVLGTLTEYSAIVGFIAVVGVWGGGVFGIYTKAVLDIHDVTLEAYPLALGLAGTVESVFDFSIPILIGYTVDATGSYALILHTLGILSMISSIALVLSQVCSTFCASKRTDRQSEDH